jgi:hypothetical protein
MLPAQTSLLNMGGNTLKLLGSDMNIYRIQQKTRAAKDLDRGFITTPDGQKPVIEFVLMAMRANRVWLPEYDPNDNRVKPICKSSDGEKPDSGTNMQTGPCETCIYSQWKEGKDKPIKPVCSLGFALMCWDLEEEMPFVFQAKGTGNKPLRKFVAKITRGKAKYGIQGIETNCCVKATLGVEYVEKTDYFLPKFTVVEKLDTDTAKFIYDTAKGIMEAFAKTDYREKEIARIIDDEPPELIQTPPRQQGGALKVPDITTATWFLSTLPAGNAKGMTWRDLMENKPLIGKPEVKGHQYLHQLASWKERPEVVEVAEYALENRKSFVQDIPEPIVETANPEDEEPPF